MRTLHVHSRRPPAGGTRVREVEAAPADARLAAAIAAPRIAIERVAPLVDNGRYPAKCCVGQAVTVEADIFMDGHDRLAAWLLWWPEAAAPPATEPQRVPMKPLGNDRWRAEFTPARQGRHRFSIEACHDDWASFHHELEVKAKAGVRTTVEVEEGKIRVRAALARAAAAAPAEFLPLARRLDQADEAAARELLLSDETARWMEQLQERRFPARLGIDAVVDVERDKAGFASWYELFPRSQGRDASMHGTFDDVIARLPAIRAMGFDVLYFPPIHPIGKANRKGRNNSLHAAADDPGSPYGIGSAEGGHDAVHPQLGGIEGFRRLRDAAKDYGLELALDIAVQFSPDHPWLKQHPEWFSWRPDGTLRYAENPPKKYEDIVNADFYAPGALPSFWTAMRDVFDYWIGEGVKIFRVDNPHTKPLPFWEWLIADVRGRHHDVIFLAEAFTRPAMMNRLAKIGFSQSYTYFTWRNTKHELTEYLTQLTREAPRDFYRPHFFVNTPDINPYFLQTSGRPGFLIRAALATTLSGLWGMYSGFELCESAPLPGKEEYLDSEKYQVKPRDWTAPGNIVAEISRLNAIRRENPALHTHLGVKFYNAFNEQVLYFGKHTADLSNFILVAVSLDPRNVQETQFEAPLWEFGLPDHGALQVEELMSGTRFTWYGKLQHWRFTATQPFAVWRIRPAATP